MWENFRGGGWGFYPPQCRNRSVARYTWLILWIPSFCEFSFFASICEAPVWLPCPFWLGPSLPIFEWKQISSLLADLRSCPPWIASLLVDLRRWSPPLWIAPLLAVLRICPPSPAEWIGEPCFSLSCSMGSSLPSSSYVVSPFSSSSSSAAPEVALLIDPCNSLVLGGQGREPCRIARLVPFGAAFWWGSRNPCFSWIASFIGMFRKCKVHYMSIMDQSPSVGNWHTVSWFRN